MLAPCFYPNMNGRPYIHHYNKVVVGVIFHLAYNFGNKKASNAYIVLNNDYFCSYI